MRITSWFTNALLAATIGGAGLAHADDFTGWQGMRVIRQEGWPATARRADLDQDGRDELIVANVRDSRLEIYRWLADGERKPRPATDPDRPNELPMAREFERVEVPLDRLPRDAMTINFDGDPQPELLVLETPPNRVVLYDFDGRTGKWQRKHEWDLLAGKLMGRERLMLRSPLAGDTPELLVSFEDGIQVLTLAQDARPRWLMPREKQGRIDWWTADLDADGDADLVEWTRAGDQTIRWYENTGEVLLPARGLTDVKADDVALLYGRNSKAEVLLLGGLQRGVLRRYAMTVDDPSPFGQLQPLPLGAGRVAWTGVEVDGQPALVTIEGDEPRLTLYRLTDAGWVAGQTFPVISKVQNVVAPPAAPGTLLLWAKDAGDLHISRYENGRFSFPRPYTDPIPDDATDRKLLSLGSAGKTVWWAQQVNKKHIDLYVWAAGEAAPVRTRFEDAGAKADEVTWLGGERLLVMEKYAQSPKLVTLADGKLVVDEPPHLAKAKLADFTLVAWEGDLRPVRIGDGVLQWLDDSLQPVDQVMLPESQRLVAFVEHERNGEHGALVLEAGGKKLHFMLADEAGVMRVAESFDAPGGATLFEDPVVGLILANGSGMVRLSAGRPRTLELQDSIDSRVGRPSGIREATIHRIATTDVDGDGSDEVVMSDDRRHQLTVLRRTDEGLEPMISWPVYEDAAYPYGSTEEETVAEPRMIAGLDFDADGHQDLAMVCHDRLLIYLGRDRRKEAN